MGAVMGPIMGHKLIGTDVRNAINLPSLVSPEATTLPLATFYQTYKESSWDRPRNRRTDIRPGRTCICTDWWDRLRISCISEDNVALKGKKIV
jgi:hypothetical protein